MATYILNVSVASNWVKYFNDNNWQFCFARNSSSVGSQTTFNVIAVADEVAANIQVTWVDSYGMAGAKTGYSAGAEITISTNVLDISFGEKFTLTEWAIYTIAPDPSAPRNGFLYETKPSSACVLYQKIGGKSVPVYITPGGILPPNTTESLVPLPQVAIWFQRSVTSSTMVDQSLTNAFIIPMTTTKMNATYDKEGKWSVQSGKVHYGLPDDENPPTQ